VTEMSTTETDLDKALNWLKALGTKGARVVVELTPAGSGPALSQDVRTAIVESIHLHMKPIALVEAWARFELIVAGARRDLTRDAEVILRVLEKVGRCTWHISYVEAHDENLRTLHCDPKYGLKAYEGRSVAVWVTPFLGDDWQESQRYPRVDLICVH
jgi:hypothetical protein